MPPLYGAFIKKSEMIQMRAAKHSGVKIIGTEVCRRTSHIVLQGSLWSC